MVIAPEPLPINAQAAEVHGVADPHEENEGCNKGEKATGRGERGLS